MIERSKDLTLAAKPLDHVAFGDRLTDDLEGDLLFKFAVGAFREVNGAHAAESDLADNSVISKPTARSRLRTVRKYLLSR